MVTRRLSPVIAAALAGQLVAMSARAQSPEQSQTQPPMQPQAPSQAKPTAVPSMTVMVVVGGSTVLRTDFPITRFALNNPAVADATVVDPKQLLVDGKRAG